ncbi:MAG: treZ [Verrucomicrobiaceae bacterium]|nr:treZ [Verrucomicrobiaceae bacterium]
MNTVSVRLGAEIETPGVRYRAWAPEAHEVEVEILSASGAKQRAIKLAETDPGFFSGIDIKGAAGDRYKFRLDGGQAFPDPWSRWQPEGVHGPSMVIDPTRYHWNDNGWRPPQIRDFVVYELHVGAFTQDGTFISAIEHLQHVRDLGANAIELMPVADFAGNRNWGYDGVSWYAPSRAYGHPDDLRRLVDAAHECGLAVILDVVYNHLGPDGNYLGSYVGDYFDETAKTPWGGAIMYGAPKFKPLRDMVVANPGYWMREFHIDGFRLDATHAIVDVSEPHILQELTESIHALGGFVIGEDSRNDRRLLEHTKDGGMGFDAVWADDFHHVIRVMNTHEDEGYLADFEGSLSEAVGVLHQGWLYCGQESKSEGKPRGTECGHLEPYKFVHCISNHDQTGNHAFGERLEHRIHPVAIHAAAALLCLGPYTPMLFMGQEWRASTPFLFFTDHCPELGKLIIEGRRAEFRNFIAFRDPGMITMLPNPQAEDSFLASKLKWEEVGKPRHASTLELYTACLSLRNNHSVFRPSGRNTWRIRELEWGAGLLFYEEGEDRWAVLFDLQGGHKGELPREPEFRDGAGVWELVLSTNETRFGGTGATAIDAATLTASFVAPETAVLRKKSERLTTS